MEKPSDIQPDFVVNNFSISSSSTRKIYLIKLFLERSREKPLNLSFSVPRGQVLEDGRGEPGDLSFDTTTAILILFFQCPHRWKSVSITCPGSIVNSAERLMIPLYEKSSTLLEELFLDAYLVYSVDELDVSTFNLRSFLLNSPRLASVRIGGLYYRTDDMILKKLPWEQLTSLTALELDLNIGVAKLPDILAQCPHLEALSTCPEVGELDIPQLS